MYLFNLTCKQNYKEQLIIALNYQQLICHHANQIKGKPQEKLLLDGSPNHSKWATPLEPVGAFLP
jgi:hypothetical protein